MQCKNSSTVFRALCFSIFGLTGFQPETEQAAEQAISFCTVCDAGPKSHEQVMVSAWKVMLFMVQTAWLSMEELTLLNFKASGKSSGNSTGANT